MTQDAGPGRALAIVTAGNIFERSCVHQTVPNNAEKETLSRAAAGTLEII